MKRCLCFLIQSIVYWKAKVKLESYAAKSLQSCPTLCDPIDGSPPVSPVPGLLQARTLEWVAISYSNAWKWKMKVKTLYPTLSDPMDCSLPGPSVHGTFQARVLEWGAIAFTVETLTYCKMITIIALAHTSIMPHVCFFIVETFKIYSLSNFQV